jgi:hypothetical protein
MSPRPTTVLVSLAVTLLLGLPAAGQPSARVVEAPGSEVVLGDDGDKAAFIAQYDDNEVDVTYAGSDTTPTFELAMRFDDIGGADVTLGSVSVCLRQTGGDSLVRYQVVLWAPNGPGGAPGTELAHFAAVATGVGATPTFDSTNLGFPLTTEDVFIGIRYNPVVDPNVGFCADRDGTTVHTGRYRSNESGTWSTIAATLDPAYNALMIRASLSTPGVFLESLLLPFFEVDRTSPAGTTTLFAARNLTADTVSADVEYFTVNGTSQATDTFTLAPFDTRTVNLRDLAGLAADGDGFARGFVEISAPGNPDMTPVLAGDFFQVDVDDNFATGEQLVRRTELCDHASVRFLDFPLPGSGTRLTVWLTNPRGGGAGDPPSFTVRVRDEDGIQVGGVISMKTDDHALVVPTTLFAPIDFGSLEFDFTNSGGGFVYAESSAEDRFSVGVASQCHQLP